MAHANQKHSNQSRSNAQLKSALSLITGEITRGPLRSSSLSKIMRDTFGGSDASGAWNWRMAYDMMQAAAVQAILTDASGSDALGSAKNLATRLLTETRRSEQQIPLPFCPASLVITAAAPETRPDRWSSGTRIPFKPSMPTPALTCGALAPCSK